MSIFAKTDKMEQRVLIKGKFGGLSIFSIFALFAGVILLILGGVMLASDSPDPTLTGAARFAPGIVGLAFLWVFVSAAFIRGKFELCPDRLEGKKKMGSAFNIAVSEIAEVRLDGSQLLVYADNKKPLLVQSSPNPREVRGLLWLLVHHSDLLPGEIWDHFKIPARGESLAGEKAYRRLFHGSDEEIQFLDGGFLFDLPGYDEQAYIPCTDTVPFLSKDEDQNSFSTQLSGSYPILHFDPNPAKVPLQAIFAAILKSPLADTQKKDLCLECVERFNGVLAKVKNVPQEDDFIDFGDWKLSLVPDNAGNSTPATSD